jgi:hypothetical protein
VTIDEVMQDIKSGSKKRKRAEAEVEANVEVVEDA